MQFRAFVPAMLTMMLAVAGLADPLTPIQPTFQESPLPPAVELPAPKQLLPDVPNRPLTVVEAAQIALHHQPNVQAAIAGVNAANARVKQARAGFGPSVTIGTGYTNDAVANGAGANSAAGYAFSTQVRQLLYDFNHTRDLVRQSSALANSAQATLSKTQSDLVFQTKQAFYTYTEDQQLVHVNENNVRNAQAHLALAKAQADNGIGLPSDVVRAGTAVSNAIFNLNVARNTAALARVNLAVLMGIDPRTPIEAADSIEPDYPTDDLQALIDKALVQRPEITQARAIIAANQHALGAAKSGNDPAIAGVLGWNQHGQSLLMNTSQTLGVGISIGWTPYDSGYTRGRVNEAKANIVNAQAQFCATQQAIIADISQCYVNLTTAAQRVKTAEDEVFNAQKALDLATGRFQAGVGVFLDVLDAESALTTAQTNLVNAKTSVQLARAAFAHALFEDLQARQSAVGD